VEFIEREKGRGTVYVHCKIGYSRSAAVVGAYLCAARAAGTVEEAIAIMRRARPSLIVRPEARRAMLLAIDFLGQGGVPGSNVGGRPLTAGASGGRTCRNPEPDCENI
jgi:protein-tyrosine phosphatase